jgi:hypothetical protein
MRVTKTESIESVRRHRAKCAWRNVCLSLLSSCERTNILMDETWWKFFSPRLFLLFHFWSGYNHTVFIFCFFHSPTFLMCANWFYSIAVHRGGRHKNAIRMPTELSTVRKFIFSQFRYEWRSGSNLCVCVLNNLILIE